MSLIIDTLKTSTITEELSDAEVAILRERERVLRGELEQLRVSWDSSSAPVAVTAEDVAEIVERTIQRGEVIERLMCDLAVDLDGHRQLQSGQPVADLLARRQQPHLEKLLGQKVLIDYKVGGGGALGGVASGYLWDADGAARVFELAAVTALVGACLWGLLSRPGASDANPATG